ncbi:peptidylprolyl isomerase [Leptolyngbya sp. FACHB-261]|uniref:peptidylprolyl isomerase n=1 Tax=Leptolyngbya sp. FACHB-261 TaxID=2692806 RepID=UPI0016855328|nr:peptidylprolyl isomerase [Leptolyngbya sp. FACHB-261]MBD2101591.1 peptidylprolyl isomerase [Leptolyngbya sp. FACHB-261]
METQPSLIVDEQAISLRQALKYLQAAGKLGPVIGDILRQHVLEQELKARADLAPSDTSLEQAVIDFRLEQDLNEPDRFQAWLTDNGLEEAEFRQQIAFDLQLDQLKVQVTADLLPEYFVARQLFLDQVVLSRIIVNNRELAEELRRQLEAGARFEQLALDHSLSDDAVTNGMMGPVSRGALPDEFRALVDAAEPGTILGPIELEGDWGLFRVERFLPASLADPQLQQALENELFEQWLAEKLQNLAVKFQIDE